MVDPFGRAVRDFYREELSGPLIQRDGHEAVEHPIEEFYFQPVDLDTYPDSWLARWVDGPLLDLGAGAGRLALAFQTRIETVAVEVSEHLVETMRDRGVKDTREGDMFDLRSMFPADRFDSVLLIGTQSGLAASRAGLRSFLEDLDYVTTSAGNAVIDSYDPTVGTPGDLPGYRRDETPGLAFRVMHFEYEDLVGRTLLFRLFSTEVLRQIAAETPWTVAAIDRPGEAESYYRAALKKE